MALGQSIARFNKLRLVVAIDGTHLKRKYKVTLFVVAYLDNNEQIYHLNFGVGDTENEQSYTWFFEMFKEAYDEVLDLVCKYEPFNNEEISLKIKEIIKDEK